MINILRYVPLYRQIANFVKAPVCQRIFHSPVFTQPKPFKAKLVGAGLLGGLFLSTIRAEKSLPLKPLSLEEEKNSSTVHAAAVRMIPAFTPQDKLEDVEQQIETLVEPLKGAIFRDVNPNCGKKHMNLLILSRLIEELDLQGVAVPVPHGVASKNVIELIELTAPEVFKEWDELKKLSLEDPKAQELIERIQKGIGKSFERAAADPKLFSLLITEEWFEKNQDYLIVRSSGSEDSAHFVNAGGNISCPYVAPNREAFCAAAAKVVGSYFGASTLHNSRNARHTSHDLNLGFTVQAIIGEPVGGALQESEIPVSLVQFTSEPGSGNFRLMRISACYGFGEGVVGGIGIQSDTALVLLSQAQKEKLYILYDNKEKPERMIPSENGMQIVANPPALMRRPALDEEFLNRLYLWGVIVEKCFDGPTDMEIVIKDGILYAVQARPIIRQEAEPTHMKPHTQALLGRGEVQVSGKSSVIKATHPSQICRAATLAEAEKLFKINQHQVVIVARPDPANSHPVVNFSTLGIPCLVVADDKDFTPSPEHPLVFCVQTGSLYQWDSAFGPLDDFIQKGYARHPAKIAISLPVLLNKSYSRGKEAPQEIKELFYALSQADENHLEILNTLRSHPFVQSLKAERDELFQKSFYLEGMRTIGSATTALHKQIEVGFNELEASLPNKMLYLFHLKALETLLLGTPSPGSLGQYSRLTLQSHYQDAQKLIRYQEKFTHRSHFADLLLLGEISPVWESYLLSLEDKVERGGVSEAQKRELIQKMGLLEKSGFAKLWMTFFFHDTHVAALLCLLPDEKSIREITAANFQEVVALAKKETDSRLLMMMKLKVINDVVDHFDLSIKEMKKSGDVRLFKKMIGTYYSLLKNLMMALPYAGYIPMNRGDTLERYFAQLDADFERFPEQGVEQLLPSAGFSVAAAAMGSGALNNRHNPHTLEDFFTLVHQNLLALLSHCSNQFITEETIANSHLPLKLKKSLKKIQVGRSGFDFSDQRIRVKYNIPLRNHSAQMFLNYDLTSEELTMQAYFMGHNENDRWNAGAHFVQALSMLRLCPLDSPVQTGSSELSWTWKASPQEIPDLLKAFDVVKDISFEFSDWGAPLMQDVVSRILRHYKLDPLQVAEIVSQSADKKSEIRMTLEYLLFKLKNGGDEAQFWAKKAVVDKDPLAFKEFADKITLNKPIYSQLIPQLEHLIVFEDPDKNSIEILKLYHKILQTDPPQAEQFAELFSTLVDTHFQSANCEVRLGAVRLSTYLNSLPEQQYLIAKQSLNDPDPSVRKTSLELFDKLPKHFSTETLAAAGQGVRDEVLDVRKGAYVVYKTLIRHGIEGCYEQALGVATQWDKHEDKWEKALALTIFPALIEHGLYLDQAQAAAQAALKGDQQTVREGLSIYHALVKKGHFFAQAKEAIKGFKERKSYLILSLLVERGEALEEAVEASFELSKSLQGNFEEFKALLMKLKEKNESTEKIMEALFEYGLKNSYWGQQQAIYEIITAVYLPDINSPALQKLIELSNSRPWDPHTNNYIKDLVAKIKENIFYPSYSTSTSLT